MCVYSLVSRPPLCIFFGLHAMEVKEWLKRPMKSNLFMLCFFNLYISLLFCTTGCFSSLFLWQHCSLASSPTALLRRCTVSHPLPPRARPALTVQPIVPHFPSMHRKLKCTSPPTPQWCSCQVTMFSIQISQWLMLPG